MGTPGVVIEDLLGALTRAIDELTRPIDAIKHQAKTVTVGISRSEEALFTAPLVAEVLAAGAPRDRLGYRALRTLAALDPAVEEVIGCTRYAIEGAADDGEATIRVVDKGGVARGHPSRAERRPRRLRGTKHRAATLREVTVARGATDGRTVVLVPEIRGPTWWASPCSTSGSPIASRAEHAGRAGGLPGPLRRPGRRRHRDRTRLR